MITHQYEIIDVHLHSWWKHVPVDPCLDPHQTYVMDEQVFSDTLAQMDNLGIRCGVVSGPNNIQSNGASERQAVSLPPGGR